MDIYIYGAGVYGKQCYEKLMLLGFHVSGFVVTTEDGNPETIFDLPVISIEKFEKHLDKSLLIVALKEKYKEEVIQLLWEKDISNYQIFSPKDSNGFNNRTNFPEIYIYGAGKYGKICLDNLQSLGFVVNGFVVSKKEDNVRIVGNIPVLGFSEFSIQKKSNAKLIVALGIKNRDEVLDVLEENKIKEYQLFTPVLNQVKNEGTVSQLLLNRFNSLRPIECVHVNSTKKRLNLVTDSIAKNSLLGGVATAIIVATMFARNNGFSLRIITRTAVSDPENLRQILEINDLDDFTDIEFYSEIDCKQKLEVSKSDIFFATSWWSAQAIKGMTIRKRFFYIIQEVETFFYPHGEDHYLCSRIMEDENIDFIINAHYLKEYFEGNAKNVSKNGIFFNPAFSKKLYALNNFIKKDKYKLFFYARPNNPRNMFYYGVYLLESAIKRGILNTEEWDIYCAGQDTPLLVFSNGYKVINKGLMDWDKYGKFLGKVDLTLSLMYTPHPSYPPYDAACAGSVVITNKCLNKIEFAECKNILMEDLDEEKFLKKMAEAIELAKNMEIRKANFESSTISNDWNENLKDVMIWMKNKI